MIMRTSTHSDTRYWSLNFVFSDNWQKKRCYFEFIVDECWNDNWNNRCAWSKIFTTNTTYWSVNWSRNT